jgi:hypothetical protein
MIPSLMIPFRLVSLSLKSYFRALWPTTWMSVTMALVCEAWLLGLRRLGVQNVALHLVTTAVLGGAVYLGLLLWRKPPVLTEVFNVVGGSSHPLARLLARVLSRFTLLPQQLERSATSTSSAV